MPKLIPTLTAGFNLVTNHIYLILFPLTLDLLLWLGPHLGIFNIAQPFLTTLQNQVQMLPSSSLSASFQMAQNMIIEFTATFNLFSLLRSFPVGVCSLLYNVNAKQTPMGNAIYYQVPDAFTAFLLLIGLFIFGIFLGSLYFRELARQTGKGLIDYHMKPWYWQFWQALLLTGLIIALFTMIFVPFTFLLSFVTLLSPFIAQGLLFLSTLLILWFIIPLYFSPHGIFLNQQTAFRSIFTSMRLIRFYLPGTSLFLLTILLLSEGLNIIWRMAPLSSWMALLGIIGHAFVASAIFASTFIFYRNGLIWMHAQMQILQKDMLEKSGRTS